MSKQQGSPMANVEPTRPSFPIRTLPLDHLRLDGQTQMRPEGTIAQAVESYSEVITRALEDGEPNPLPPAIVFHDAEDNVYWLADGFQRHAAHRRAGCAEMRCEIRPGDVRAARLYACGANEEHGTRRSNAAKRRSV